MDLYFSRCVNEPSSRTGSPSMRRYVTRPRQSSGPSTTWWGPGSAARTPGSSWLPAKSSSSQQSPWPRSQSWWGNTTRQARSQHYIVKSLTVKLVLFQSPVWEFWKLKCWPRSQDKEDKSEDKPAAQTNEAKDKSVKVAQAKNGQAYQVMFDDSQQKMKMQKPATASFNHSKLPPIVMKGQGPGQDLRRLSAQNWRKQRKQV